MAGAAGAWQKTNGAGYRVGRQSILAGVPAGHTRRSRRGGTGPIALRKTEYIETETQSQEKAGDFPENFSPAADRNEKRS